LFRYLISLVFLLRSLSYALSFFFFFPPFNLFLPAWPGSALSPEHGAKCHSVKSDPTPFGFKGTLPSDNGGGGAHLTQEAVLHPPIPHCHVCL